MLKSEQTRMWLLFYSAYFPRSVSHQNCYTALCMSLLYFVPLDRPTWIPYFIGLLFFLLHCFPFSHCALAQGLFHSPLWCFLICQLNLNASLSTVSFNSVFPSNTVEWQDSLCIRTNLASVCNSLLLLLNCSLSFTHSKTDLHVHLVNDALYD